jgi:hypothetical protein
MPKNSRKAPKASKKARRIPEDLRAAFEKLNDEKRGDLISFARYLVADPPIKPDVLPAPAQPVEEDINDWDFEELVENSPRGDYAKLRPERAREMVRDGVRAVYETSLAVGVHAGLLRAVDENELSERYVPHEIASEICPKAIQECSSRLTLAIDTLRDLLEAMGAYPGANDLDPEDVPQTEEQTA